jgi:SAM-dependent methyltransferase
LVLHLRRSRRRARDAAVAEVAALFGDRGGRALRGGPLSEVSGVAWVGLDDTPASVIAERLAFLGYTEAVDLVRPADQVGDTDDAWLRARWKGRDVVLVPVYAESDDAWRAGAPDQRSFLLECGDGVVRRIEGYRGGRRPLEHRALPVADARLLVNLVASPSRGRLLDPFAGAGGVVIQAHAAGWQTYSIDADPTLRYGLAELADLHAVGDAAALPFATGSLDAVATEPPYHASALDSVVAAVPEIGRVLRPGGRASVLVGADQAEAVLSAGKQAGLTAELDTAIDRKGTPVVCIRWLR